MILLDLNWYCVIDGLCKTKLLKRDKKAKKEAANHDSRRGQHHPQTVENQGHEIAKQHGFPYPENGSDFSTEKRADSHSKCSEQYQYCYHVHYLSLLLLGAPFKLHIENEANLAGLRNDPPTLDARCQAPDEAEASDVAVVDL